MEGFSLEIGLWWRANFDNDTRKLFQPHVQGRDDLSVNGLELLAKIVTA